MRPTKIQLKSEPEQESCSFAPFTFFFLSDSEWEKAGLLLFQRTLAGESVLQNVVDVEKEMELEFGLEGSPERSRDEWAPRPQGGDRTRESP